MNSTSLSHFAFGVLSLFLFCSPLLPFCTPRHTRRAIKTRSRTQLQITNFHRSRAIFHYFFFGLVKRDAFPLLRIHSLDITSFRLTFAADYFVEIHLRSSRRICLRRDGSAWTPAERGRRRERIALSETAVRRRFTALYR